MKYIDSHVHLDQYDGKSISEIVEEVHLDRLVTVSIHLDSCKINKSLSEKYTKVYPAYGYHPEQSLPTNHEKELLFNWIRVNASSMVAVGEVGLPYYLRKQGKVSEEDYLKYIVLLEEFCILTRELYKPIVLHAVYEDATIACDMLENHRVKKAHFHWFKGDEQVITRLMNNGYFISITPDVLYEKEIQHLVETYPLELLFVETDGPWQFEGPFESKTTAPWMMNEAVKKIAEIKNVSVEKMYARIYENTKSFYFER